MKFLVYTAEPYENNATLSSFRDGEDKMIARLVESIEAMNLQRVANNQTVNLLAKNIDYNQKTGIVTADVYKQTSRGKALHQLTEDGDEITIEQILSEHEDAFVQGILGMKKVGDEVHMLLERNFGSFFRASCKGIDISPKFSSDTIQAIQDSETIGRTTLDFADDYDLTASLFKPPEDQDVREEEGFGNVNLANKLTSLLDISTAHRMSLDINRDTWLENVSLFDELISAGIVKKIRIEQTANGVVRLGQGGDRAIRKTIKTSNSEREAVQEAFENFPDDI